MLNEALNGLVVAVALIAFFLLGIWATWDHEHKKRVQLEEKMDWLRQAIEALVCDDRQNALLATVVWRVKHQKKGAGGDWKRIAAIARALLPLNPSVTFVNTWLGYQWQVHCALTEDMHDLVNRIRRQLRDLSEIVRESIPDEIVAGGLDARTSFSELVLQASQALTPAPKSEKV